MHSLFYCLKSPWQTNSQRAAVWSKLQVVARKKNKPFLHIPPLPHPTPSSQVTQEVDHLTCIWVAKPSLVAWSHCTLQMCIISLRFHASGESCLLSMWVNPSLRLCERSNMPRRSPTSLTTVLSTSTTCVEALSKSRKPFARLLLWLCRGLENSDASD